MGKISIIIPVYNVENYIDICISSILAQTYQNLEILLIDDGSTDDSGLLCDKYGQQDRRIRVFHKKNGGVSSARNLGIEKATGTYISFVDPDDWIEPDMYAVIKEQFDRTDADVVFCGYWEDYPQSLNLSSILHMPDKQGGVNGQAALYQCLIGMGYGYFTSVWNKVFKADFIKKSQIFFENFAIGEDEVWLAKILPKAKNVQLMNKPFYHWLQRETSVLHSGNNYDKWGSALKSKIAVLKAVRFDKTLYLLSEAKVYNDVFDIVWQAYIAEDREISKDFMKKLKPYEKAFYMNKHFSKAKRIKFFTIKKMIAVKINPKIVARFASLTSYKLKEKWKG